MAEEVRADHIKVKWKKPKDNGGEELKGYIIEKMDLDTGRWVSAGEVKTKQSHLAIAFAFNISQFFHFLFNLLLTLTLEELIFFFNFQSWRLVDLLFTSKFSPHNEEILLKLKGCFMK